MTWTEIMEDETEEILSTKWDKRDGTVIPEAEAVTLADGAVEIDATFLYADLAGSSQLAKLCPWETTAKIIKAYLHISTRLIRAYGGEIRSFDGDRVMGIFIGDYKNTNACRCAREIFWSVEKILNPKAAEKFKSVKENNIKIKQCVGIDTGKAYAVRSGIRNNNDLIWIGAAPSIAAKLSDIREYPYCVYITDSCYKKLGDEEKIVDGNNIWGARTFEVSGDSKSVYRTNFLRTP
ncbi:MAG: adenylate/guanylate cyclase domain-containing protein [Patescibacteria group bacterium]